ncbi:MAG: hypothetical protein R3202_01870 [Candidatus Competibacterales bacterium]|nr:hypothetical protein [Candidatus Competibacterales bacterium]
MNEPVTQNIRICTYEDLAIDLRRKASELSTDVKYWIGLVGAPGSGKSTLAKELKFRLGSLLTIIPMDGYHYYRHELDGMEDPEYAHLRRGAPFTFNASRFVADLIAARERGSGSFPSFDHNVGDPVEDAIQLEDESTRIVMVEGNYLLLDTEPWCRLRTEVFDESWFLYVPAAESSKRVYQRHLETGQLPTVAHSRVELNDSINAKLIMTTSVNADQVIQILDDRKGQPPNRE